MITVAEKVESTAKENEHTYIVNIVKEVSIFGWTMYKSSKIRRI